MNAQHLPCAAALNHPRSGYLAGVIHHSYPEGKNILMRARTAISVLVAVVALLTVGAGAGFAQGLDSSGSAGTQQYGKVTTVGTVDQPKAEKPKSERLGVIGEIE